MVFVPLREAPRSSKKKKKKTHPGILGWFYPAEGVHSLSLTPVTVQRSLEAN